MLETARRKRIIVDSIYEDIPAKRRSLRDDMGYVTLRGYARLEDCPDSQICVVYKKDIEIGKKKIQEFNDWLKQNGLN